MILNIKIGDIVIKINNKKRNKKEQKVNYSQFFEYFWKVKKKPRPNNSLNIIMNFKKKEKKKWKFFFNTFPSFYIFVGEKKKRHFP